MIEGLDILTAWLMFVINIKYVWGRCGRAYALKPREVTDEEGVKTTKVECSSAAGLKRCRCISSLFTESKVKGKKLSSVENRTLSREHDQKRNKDREHDSFYLIWVGLQVTHKFPSKTELKFFSATNKSESHNTELLK